MKEGIKYIHNKKPLWGNSAKVKLEFVRKIGEPVGDDENYLFYHPSDIQRDEDGNIYVADYSNHHIKKFNDKGQYLKTIGGPGQGPGELFLPTCIDLDPYGNIYICDQRGFTIFDPEGKFIDGFKTVYFFWEFKVLNPNEILTYDFSDSLLWQKKGKEVPLFKVLNLYGDLLRGFGKRKKYENLSFTASGNSISAAVDQDKNIYVVFSCQNRIEKYSSDGILLFIADRRLKYKLTKKMVKEERTSSSLETTVEMEVAKMTLVSAHIAVDGHNRIWVMTCRKKPPGNKQENLIDSSLWEYEIFNSDGVLLGKVPKFMTTIIKGTCGSLGIDSIT